MPELGRFVMKRAVYTAPPSRRHVLVFGQCAFGAVGVLAGLGLVVPAFVIFTILSGAGVLLAAFMTMVFSDIQWYTDASGTAAGGIYGFSIDEEKEPRRRGMEPVEFVVTPTVLRVGDRGELDLAGLHWRFRKQVLVLSSGPVEIQVEHMVPGGRQPLLGFLENAREMGNHRHGRGAADIPEGLAGLRNRANQEEGQERG